MNKNRFLINLIYQSIVLLLVLSAIVYSCFWLNSINKSDYGFTSEFAVSFTVVILLFYFIYFYICLLYLINVFNNFKFSKKYLILFFAFFLNPFVFLNENIKNEFFIYKIGLTKKITQIGFIFSIYIIFSFIFYTYQLPLGIEIPIGYAIILYYALNNRFVYSFSLTIICCLFQAFLPGVIFLNIYQYMLDYGFIILSISLASFFRFNSNQLKLIFLNISLISFLLCFIFFISRLISGVIFWLSNLDSSLNAFSYSAIYNSLNVIIDFITLSTTVSFLLWRIPKQLWN